MTHPDFTAKSLTNVLASAGGAFAVFFVVFSYLFKQEFVCPCDPADNTWFCSLYIILPFIFFFGSIIMMDHIFLEICTLKKCRAYFGVLLRRLLRAFTVGSLWIATALIDGDWWVCIQTTSPNITVRSEQPACKQGPTGDEFAAMRHWESVSRVFGFVLLCAVLLLWTFVLCWSKRKGDTYYNKSVYDEYVLEETDNSLKKKLKEFVQRRAEDKAQTKLDKMYRMYGDSDATLHTDYEQF